MSGTSPRRMLPQKRNDLRLAGGRLGEDVVGKREAFFAQRLLSVDDGVEQQGEGFAACEAVRFAVGEGGEYREVVFVAEEFDQLFGVRPLGAHGGRPELL